MRNALVIAAAAAAVIGALVYAVRYLDQSGVVEMSVHGWIASGIGILATLGLGFGLMRLSYLSSRRGHDDAAGRPPGA